ALSLVVGTAACSVVVDDTLAGKPGELTTVGLVGGGGQGASGGGGPTGSGGFGGDGGTVLQGGGGQGGAGGHPVVCQLNDDFDDGVIVAVWKQRTTTSSDVGLDETGGTLQIVIPAGSGNRWGRVRSYGMATDACGLTVAFVPSGGVPNGEEVAYAELNQNETLRAGFHLHGSTLEYWKKIDATETVVASQPYDPVAHAWWRLRRDGGELVWETSSGTGWVERAREASALEPSQAEITLGAGVYDGFTSDGLTVRYDNLNVNTP